MSIDRRGFLGATAAAAAVELPPRRDSARITPAGHDVEARESRGRTWLHCGRPGGQMQLIRGEVWGTGEQIYRREIADARQAVK